MATKRTETKAAVAGQAAQVKSAPMQDVTEKLASARELAELKAETPGNLVSQDNTPKTKAKPAKETEVLDATSAKAGQFPIVPPNVYEAMYSRTKVIEEVSKPLNMKDLETSIDNMYTKLRFDLPTEINILCCRVMLGTILFGNVWPARKLLQAFGAAPKGASKTMFRAVALRDWLIDKGPFKPWQDVNDMIDYTTGKVVESTKGLVVDGNKRRELEAAYKKDQAGFIKELADTPFWIYKPLTEASFAKFDFKKELGKLLQRAAKMEQRLGEHKDGDEIHLEGLQAVRAILPKINAGQVTIDPSTKVTTE